MKACSAKSGEDGKSPSQGVRSSPPKCPECSSDRVWKDGLRKTWKGSIQRFICRSCGYRFSETSPQRKVEVNVSRKPSETLHPRPDLLNGSIVNPDPPFKEGLDDPPFPFGEDVGSHEVTVVGKDLNTLPSYISKRRVCAEEVEAKNLAAVETRQNQAAGATLTEQDFKGKIIEYIWWMKKEGYAESTITTRAKILKILVKRGANLFDPESIKETIAKQEWCNKRKVNAADAYSCFLRMHNLTWKPPKYRVAKNLPFIPTETEIDQLIAGCSRMFTPLLQLLKETGMRIGETSQLKWIDVDLENGTVRVTPEKGSDPRMFQISSKLRAMLTQLQASTTSEKVFPRSVRNQRRIFQRQRKRVAAKLHNPRIEKITFHTFRHFKATMEYHKTKDILHVMRILGHKNINNTLIYTHLVDFKDDEYVSKVASTAKEACKLVEAGFQFVCEVKGVHVFRKRK